MSRAIAANVEMPSDKHRTPFKAIFTEKWRKVK